MSPVTSEFVIYRGKRGPSREWTPERRTRFLLRHDVACPVSLDKVVLPEPAPSDVPWLELIATVVPTPSSGEAVRRFRGSERYDEPIPSQPAWRLLGYDVCDETGTSALMNCSTGDDTRAQTWAPRLNEHHLFDLLEPADEFRAESDRAVPEHAPFCVIALYTR